jgi:multidrug transporter EmrE-like cation transporter
MEGSVLTAWIWLAGAVAFNAAANILMKVGSSHLSSNGLVAILRTGWIPAGVVSFAVALICYVAALRRFPLNVAYPIMTGIGFLIVSVISVAVLGEEYSMMKAAGTAAIFLGLGLLTRP